MMDVQTGEGIDLITGDRVKIKQVRQGIRCQTRLNLPLKGGRVRIGVEYAEDPNGRTRDGAKSRFLRFSVYDTGVGIGPADKERIFDEFEQVDSRFQGSTAVLELGLALSKKLVELHGGEYLGREQSWGGKHVYFYYSGNVSCRGGLR